MDLPKCRICGGKHRLGGCPSSLQSKTNQFEDVARGRSAAPKTSRESPANPDQDVARQHEHRPKSASGRKSSGNQPASRGTKPAKKAKPKKEKKNVKAKKAKSRSSRKHKGRSAGPDVQRPSRAKPLAQVDASNNLPAGAGDVAKLAAGQIKVGPPRKGEEHKTLTATKPWEKLGMSRAKWYRGQKKGSEAKP